jgi:hypothetical protein
MSIVGIESRGNHGGRNYAAGGARAWSEEDRVTVGATATRDCTIAAGSGG